MKKLLLFFVLLTLVLSGCTGRSTLEEFDANAPVTVEDKRTAAQSSASVTTAKSIGVTSPLTGREVLKPASFKVNDPENTRGLSTERVEHSFGVAKNGEPHEISKSTQEYFESTGYKAICYDTKTAEKVLYLTFDCGWENGYTSKVLDTLKEKKVPAAFFCTLEHIQKEPKLIARMINEGHIVGNHSAKHPNFSEISRQRMADEILTCDNYLRENFGYATTFFRFPEGSYNESALELIDSMGYTMAFWSSAYADWDVSQTKGGDYAFEKVTSRLHPGAIILLHSVSPDNAEALGDIIDWARQNGYEFRALTEYPA
ncbi:MAG: polysaccharide deacetylase family protein [Clostridia bacterium]|nr:polysaccharide deacetylase family protein [Clostridia bacterium]